MATSLQYDGTFSHADTTAGAAGSTTGVPDTAAVGAANAWTDVNGGVSRILANELYLTGSTETDFVVRPDSEGGSDQSVLLYPPVADDYNPGNGWRWVAMLRFGAGATAAADNGYAVHFEAAGASVLRLVPGGNPAGLASASASLVGGRPYRFTADVTGSVITATITDLSGTDPDVVATATDDTLSAGVPGLKAENFSAMPVSRVQIYSDAAAPSSPASLSASLASESALTAAASLRLSLSASLASESALTADQGSAASLSASLASESALTAAASLRLSLSASLASESALTADQGSAASLSASLASASALTAAASLRLSLSASLASASALTAEEGSAAPVSIREAVQAAALASVGVTAVVGSRVNSITTPEGKALPALSIQLVSDTPRRTLTGPLGKSDALIRFVCRSRSVLDGQAVAGALRNALDGFQSYRDGLLGGTVWADFVNERDEADEKEAPSDGSDRGVIETPIVFAIRYKTPKPVR